MVKKYKITLAFFKLIRFSNLLVMAATMFLMRFAILKPILGIYELEPQMPLHDFILMVLAILLIAAGGYIINDYFDRKSDYINRPGQVIVGRLIKRRYAQFFHIFFSALGLILGAYAAYEVGRLNFSIIFIFAVVALWFYSLTYKKQLIIGNVIVSLLVAMVPLMVLIFEIPLLAENYKLHIIAKEIDFSPLNKWVIAFSVFAFVVNLIREIVKDIEDAQGDLYLGRESIPLKFGVKASKIIVGTLVLLTIGTLILLLIKVLNDKYSLIYVIAFVILPLGYLLMKLIMAKEKQHYRHLSSLLKLIMLTGVMYSLLVSYIIKSFIT